MKNKYIFFLVIFISFLNAAFSQNWAWAKAPSNSTQGDEGVAVCNDQNNNIIITGGYGSPALVYGTTTLTSPGVFVVKYDINGNVIWAKSSNSNYGGNFGMGIHADNAGNIFIAGHFDTPTISFGSYTLTNAGSYADMFIAKYDQNGNVLWAKRAGGNLVDEAVSVTTDASGNSYLTGTFQSASITFGTYTLTNSSTTTGQNLFYVKYDALGNVIWAKSAGGIYTDVAASICTDPTGNIFLTGTIGSTSITFGSITLTNAGSENIFLTKLDASGNTLWAKQAGAAGPDRSKSVSTDASGNVFITGNYYSPSLSFGTTTLTGGYGFLAKYDTNGNPLWAKNISSPTNCSGTSVCSGPGGVCFITGTFGGSVTLGTTTLTVAAGYDPVFIAKYDPNGNLICASALSSGGDDWNGVSTDQLGNAYLVSDFQPDTFVVGIDTLTFNSGGENIYLAKYFCDAQGINDLNTENIHIEAGPNPASDKINISSELIINSITITDVFGKTIFNIENINKTNLEINTSLFAPGIYIATLRSENRTGIKKFIRE